jgi:hypothetical protein
MIRKRFDREAAWAAFQLCVPKFAAILKKSCNQEHDHEDVAECGHEYDGCKECAVLEGLYHDAYALVDETVEIGVRQVFAKYGNKDDLNDLRQAARLRLYKFLPKMATFCLNSEHYFRLCLSAVRRASLNEYARLKRQGRAEITNDIVEILSDEGDSVELSHDVSLPDDGFEAREARIRVSQIVINGVELIRQRLAKTYAEPRMRAASYLVLNTMLLGTEVADSVLRDTFGVRYPKDLRHTVELALREAVHEQASSNS